MKGKKKPKYMIRKGYSVYLTDKQKEEVEKRALEAELSFSEYVRMVLFLPKKE